MVVQLQGEEGKESLGRKESRKAWPELKKMFFVEPLDRKSHKDLGLGTSFSQKLLKQ
jgi:hypothetical protein